MDGVRLFCEAFPEDIDTNLAKVCHKVRCTIDDCKPKIFCEKTTESSEPVEKIKALKMEDTQTTCEETPKTACEETPQTECEETPQTACEETPQTTCEETPKTACEGERNMNSEMANLLSFNTERSNLTPYQVYALVTQLRRFFRIENSNVIVKIYRVIERLDQYHYMQDNIDLYNVAVLFLIYLKRRFPNLFSNEFFIPVFLIMVLMITHKYFVDNPYDNKTISILYNIPIERINRYEMEILKMLDYQLPFVTQACS
jgi:hypothetical protein